MTQNEYFKISVSRGSFNKKGLLYVLADFFSVASIFHDEVNKSYSVPSSEIARFSQEKLNLFTKVVRHFNHFDMVKDGRLHFKYSLS